MYARLRALWKNTTNRLRGERGDMLIFGIFVTLIVAVVFLIAFEKWRVINISAEASNKINTTVVSIAASHINDSYAPIRDATSGAFVYDGEEWEEIKDTENFYKVFVTLHQHTARTSGGVRGGISSNGYMYEIADVKLMVNNAGVTPNKTIYRVEYTLKVPQQLLWRDVVVTMPKQVQRVEYLKKF